MSIQLVFRWGMHFHLQENFLFQLQLRRGFDHLFWGFFIRTNRYKEGYWKGRPKEILSHSISGYKRICALWGHIYLQTWHFACPLSGTVSVVYHIDTDVVEIGHLFITEKCCRKGESRDKSPLMLPIQSGSGREGCFTLIKLPFSDR